MDHYILKKLKQLLHFIPNCLFTTKGLESIDIILPSGSLNSSLVLLFQ